MSRRRRKHLDPNSLPQLPIQPKRKKKFRVIPQTHNQKRFMDLLYDPEIAIVFAVGPAGTGKTYLASYWAMTSFIEHQFKRIIITRPNVPTDDRDIGFLPGNMINKMIPWVTPVLDVFREFYTNEHIKGMMSAGLIEIVPIPYIRGRSFRDSVVIVDEAQNLSPKSMKSVLTRVGENTKMIVTGDIEQSDHEDSGLRDFLRKASGHDMKYIGIVGFSDTDIVRHPVIQEVLEIYDE